MKTWENLVQPAAEKCNNKQLFLYFIFQFVVMSCSFFFFFACLKTFSNKNTPDILNKLEASECYIKNANFEAQTCDLLGYLKMNSQICILFIPHNTTGSIIFVPDDASAGPPPRMPEGVKPLCGYVHPDDVKKWMVSTVESSAAFLIQ